MRGKKAKSIRRVTEAMVTGIPSYTYETSYSLYENYRHDPSLPPKTSIRLGECKRKLYKRCKRWMKSG